MVAIPRSVHPWIRKCGLEVCCRLAILALRNAVSGCHHSEPCIGHQLSLYAEGVVLPVETTK
jgi:hypothetical protein